ncbi:MAG TPA: hypothetical protein VMR96_00255 [Solirubrobacterales bacterium]|nr:hypothetical protein [Solirubrobacterales bacterium]
MRVLLKKGAERATAETILAVGPSLRESVLTTLAGEGGQPGGVVAEVDSWTVAEAIDTAAEKHRAPAAAVRSTRIEEVEWMAGILAAYELGSELVHHVTRTGCALELPKSKRLSGPTLTPHERRRYEEADERGDYGSIACRLGRLGDARDATAQSLEELRRRPEARATDVGALKVQLHDYDRELADLRRRSLANPSG